VGDLTRPAELVRVSLADAEETLAAAWYPPAGGDATVALLHLHGKGGNFYSGPGLFIPQLDTSREFAHLALNMRSHDLGYTRYDVPIPDAHEGTVAVAGGMWERLSDGCPDVLAGMRWLRERGCARVFLVGHSSGAYYAAQACATRPDEPAGAVLLSTVISHKRHLASWFPEPGGLDAAVARATELVEAGEGHRLLPVASWYYAISAASLLERLAEPDAIFERFLAATRVPVMFACGENETRVAQWRALYEALPPDRARWLVLPGASHDYLGVESTLADAVLGFARRCG
jgi:pimeloyl-ACP methyl ester carboxylesterase